ncbi:MAG: serpin family protein [Clostridiales bacterium]|nr:serpin family protein [Clostridiales bacterium]
MRKKLIVLMSVILAFGILLSCVSCGSNQVIETLKNATEEETNAETTEKTEYEQVELSVANLLSDFSRSAKYDVIVSDQMVKALNNFTFAMNKLVTKKDGKNVIVSPLSAFICLAMLANGTNGESRVQMEKVLGMKIEDLNESLYAFVNGLYSSENCKMSIADSFWFRDADGVLNVKNEYLQVIADWYDAEIFKALFDAQTLSDINNWCSNKTDGLIDKILDSIPDNAMMYLINAVLFDAKWEVEYKDSNVVKDYTFNNYDKSTKLVTMLGSTESVYLTGTDCVGTRKDYEGGKYSLVTLLPNKGVDIYDFISSLDANKWKSIWDSRFKNWDYEVHLMMPEFKTECEIGLNEALQTMGMVDVFTPNADLTGMANCAIGELMVSNVKQKAYIEVTKEGTKAAAVTVVEMVATSVGPGETKTVSIVLDRPYVYAIVDNSTGCPIFIGANINFK